MGVNFAWTKNERGAGARVLLGRSDGSLDWPAGAPAADRSAVAAWWRAQKRGRGQTSGAAWVFGPLSLPTLVVWHDSAAGAQAWFRAWAAAGRALAAVPSVRKAVAWDWPDADPAAGPRATVPEALLFGAFSPKEDRDWTFAFAGPSWTAEKASLERSRVIGETQSELRAFGNTPANALSPDDFARAAETWARATPGLSCKIWDEKALEYASCGAILGVAAGSARPPRLVRLAWAGTAPASSRRAPRPLALVGKGVTFDAGGICLKPAKGMEWMQYDKGGALAVVAAVLMAARTASPRPLFAWAVLSDNMPGGSALRPGDVVRAANGTSVQVVNTDAEGRLLLADALALAAAERPAALVDVATLTGAVVVALGRDGTAVLGDDPATDELEAAAESVGERLWRLPLWPEFDAALESPFADCKNMGDGTGGTITAAAFLRRFVPEGLPWAHLDIAGTGWVEKPLPWAAEGATLAAARLLLDWSRDSAL